MADRTAAEIFGRIFELLAAAKNGDSDPELIARDVFEMTKAFDFSTYQMYADDALEELGIIVEE